MEEKWDNRMKYGKWEEDGNEDRGTMMPWRRRQRNDAGGVSEFYKVSSEEGRKSGSTLERVIQHPSGPIWRPTLVQVAHTSRWTRIKMKQHTGGTTWRSRTRSEMAKKKRWNSERALCLSERNKRSRAEELHCGSTLQEYCQKAEGNMSSTANTWRTTAVTRRDAVQSNRKRSWMDNWDARGNSKQEKVK